MLGHARVGLIARRGGRRHDIPTRAWDNNGMGRRYVEFFGEKLTGDDGPNRDGRDGPNKSGLGADDGRDGPNRSGLGTENAYGLIIGPSQYRLNRDGLLLDQSGPSKKFHGTKINP